MKNIKIIGKGRKYGRKIYREWKLKDGSTHHNTYYYQKYKPKVTTTVRSSELIVKDGTITEYGKIVIKDLKESNKLFAIKVDEKVTNAELRKESLTDSKLRSQLQRAIEEINSPNVKSKNPRARQYLYNMGADIEALAADMGISERDLVNNEYWTFEGDKGVFRFGGNVYRFKFNYKEENITWQVSLM